MATNRTKRISDLVDRKRHDSVGKDERILSSSSKSTDLAHTNASGNRSRRPLKESKRIYISFSELMINTGSESEEEFILGLLTDSFRAIRVLNKSATSYADADFVFNNIATKIVMKTGDILIQHDMDFEE